ncbi:hypothetical protein T11_1867 [Trichinella zimbabwensis]|uniref:Uncharacterized protein n=1 Tax=Trichinella zimbabwensis TaxID=268475 RepID=A0A0V1GHX9_9BILA|nr:hypothetical protein T11_1867 [Trichinella zimbabwensis]
MDCPNKFYSNVKNAASTEKYASRFCFEEVTDVHVSYVLT